MIHPQRGKLSGWFWMVVWAAVLLGGYKIGLLYYNYLAYESELTEQVDKLLLSGGDRVNYEAGGDGQEMIKKMVLELAFRYDAVLSKKDIQITYDRNTQIVRVQFPYTTPLNLIFYKRDILRKIDITRSGQKYEGTTGR